MSNNNFHVHGAMFSSVVKVFILIWLLAICPARFSDADDNEIANQLIQAYVQAVKVDDPVLVKSAWNAFNDNDQAVEYMRRNMPRLDYLFRLRGLYLQLQEIQSSRPEFLGGQNSSSSIGSSVETLKSDLSPQIILEVAKFSLSEPDKTSRRTNRDIVQDAQGRSLIDNREIALANPNQNRIDNVDYVQNRVDRMFSKKFQQAPDELVPRGDTFPKTKILPAADVHIQGLSTAAIIHKTSKANQSVDVSLNGRMIAHDLVLNDALTAVNLYFETGMNILKVSCSDCSDKNAASFVIAFEKTLVGKKEFAFRLPSARSYELRIKAEP